MCTFPSKKLTLSAKILTLDTVPLLCTLILKVLLSDLINVFPIIVVFDVIKVLSDVAKNSVAVICTLESVSFDTIIASVESTYLIFVFPLIVILSETSINIVVSSICTFEYVFAH